MLIIMHENVGQDTGAGQTRLLASLGVPQLYHTGSLDLSVLTPIHWSSQASALSGLLLYLNLLFFCAQLTHHPDDAGSKHLWNVSISMRLHGATSQKTIIFSTQLMYECITFNSTNEISNAVFLSSCKWDIQKIYVPSMGFLLNYTQVPHQEILCLFCCLQWFHEHLKTAYEK
jgi:hypothetical protein